MFVDSFEKRVSNAIFSELMRTIEGDDPDETFRLFPDTWSSREQFQALNTMGDFFRLVYVFLNHCANHTY